MDRPRGLRMSLARKISLLFGAAVLLTIAVTLFFPWLHMAALNEQATLLQAKRVASTAFQAVDLREPNWESSKAQLRQRWPLLARELGLPLQRPQLVRDVAGMAPGFRRDAIERLRAHPEQRYYWRSQDHGRWFRFAMAVRGIEADRHPQILRGIIDVRLPTPQAPGVWSTVITLLAGASGAVLAILVFYMVSQRLLLSPVRQLQQVAEKVTTGDIAVRPSIRSGDEFEDLSEAFADMLTHVRKAQDEQEKINRSLDIRLGQLGETNVALYESNRLKSEFLANVTHELRTPLVSIIGFAELLRDASERPEDERKRLVRYAENILTSGRSLLEIINDLLDLAKIEAGKLPLHLTEFSMATLCTDLVDFVRPLADKRNQDLDLTIADNTPPCHNDSGKVKQILYNLLSNAIKFTPTGGSVSLTLERIDDQHVRMVVKDTGPGIPEEQQERIFEKFRQLDSSRTREFEGTGLGLAITKELVAVLGGSIAVESVEEQGSRFIVELPATVRTRPSAKRISLT